MKKTAAETAINPALSDQDLRCPCYCEENVWRLAYRKLHPMTTTSSESTTSATICRQTYFVTFISNARKCVPMYHQRAAGLSDEPCCWDYHVILLGIDDSATAWVYDLDTTLSPHPIRLSTYLQKSFPTTSTTSTSIRRCYDPFFRVIPAAHFLQYFGSDRSHMYNAVTGRWSAPPPDYDCIVPLPKENNGDDDRILAVDDQSVMDLGVTSSDPSTVAVSKVEPARSNLAVYLQFDDSPTELDLPLEALGSMLSLEQIQVFDFQRAVMSSK